MQRTVGTKIGWRIERFLLWALIALMLGAVSADAGAVSLYWAKTPVRSASTKTCLQFARMAFHDLSYERIRVSPNEVAGEHAGLYAAITCVATNPATAMVMVAGEEGSATSEAAAALQKKIAGITLID